MEESQKITDPLSSSDKAPSTAGHTRRMVWTVILWLLAVATLITVVLPLLALAWLMPVSGNEPDSGFEVAIFLPLLFYGLFVTLLDLLYVPLYIMKCRPKGVYLIISGFVLLVSVVYVVVVEWFLH